MALNKRMFKFLSYNFVKTVGAFWLVMLLVNTLTAILAIYFNSTVIIGPVIREGHSISLAGSNMFAVLVYFIVYGLETYYENFSLAAGFGVTRKNFYMNIIIHNLLVALVFGVIQIILLKIDIYVVSMLGFGTLVEYGLFNIEKNSIITATFLLSFVFLVFISIMNLIGILQYRFSYKFWIGFGLFIFVSQVLTNSIGRLVESIMDVITNAQLAFSNGIFLGVGTIVILLAYSIGFLLIRRANIK